MIIINSIDSQKFSYNGVNYYKNFTPISVSADKIRILNTYDSKIELTEFPVLFSDVILNGVVYASLELLQNALLPVLFTRNSLGSVDLNGLQETLDNGDTWESSAGDTTITINEEKLEYEAYDPIEDTLGGVFIAKDGSTILNSDYKSSLLERLFTNTIGTRINGFLHLFSDIRNYASDILRRSEIVFYENAIRISSFVGGSGFGVNITTDNLTADADVQFGEGGGTVAYDKVLVNSITPTTAVVGTLLETVMYTWYVPANTFSATDRIVIDEFSCVSNGTLIGTSTARIRFNTVNTLPATTDKLFATVSFSAGAGDRYFRMERTIDIIGGKIKGLFNIVGSFTDKASNTYTSNDFNPAVDNYFFFTIQPSDVLNSIYMKNLIIRR